MKKIVFAFLLATSPILPEEPNVVVIGGGIGGLTSALYLARAGLNPIVIEGTTPGGLITQSHSVQNWPGELEITGQELAAKVRSQVESNGASFLSEEVTGVDFSKRPFKITTNKRQLHAETVIIAMGTKPNHLGVPGEMDYWGKGVTNCAICDGSLYRGGKVGIVGGGDAAVLEALYLSNIAKEVTVFIRKDKFKGIEEKRIQALLARPNVKLLYMTSVQEVKGDGTKVTGVTLKTNGKSSFMPLDGLFLAIGSTPNSQLFQGKLKLDKQGYIALVKDQETSVPGVYAIGDIVDPVYKQAVSAAGDGAKAAMQAERYMANTVMKPISKNDLLVLNQQTVISTEIPEITTRDQLQKELKAATPVLVEFYAPWCGACQSIQARFQEAADQLKGKVKFLKVNADTEEKLFDLYEVKSMPTAILFDKNGKVQERKVGADQILSLLKTLENSK